MEYTHVRLPLDKSFIEVDVPNVIAVAEPHYMAPVPDARAEVRRAIQNPIGSPRLKDIAKGKHSAAIVVNDITRPYQGGLMVEELAEELHLAGLTDDEIFLVVAYGTHRVNTPEELVGMFGEEVCRRFRFVHHYAEDDSTLKTVGVTAEGMTVQINKEFAEAEVKITTGLITPHACAGYSGGRKSIVPGISGMECLKQHHSFPIVPADPAMGWLKGNKFHEWALDAARLVGVDFIVNHVDNAEREMVLCVAGDVDAAHLAGTEICKEIWQTKVPTRADVVIATSGGFPRDIDLHQAQKACSVSEMACKLGGHIILVAKAQDGGAKFGCVLKEANSPQEVVDLFAREGMRAGGNRGKAYMWARGMLKHKMSVANSVMSKEELNSMFIDHYETVEDAIEDSLRIYGENASFIVIPHAADMFVTVEDEQ